MRFSRLTRLSADGFTADKTEQSFYTGDVDVPSSSYVALRDREGHAYMLRAGMPVQVLMTVRRRTVLDYALEPLTGAFWPRFANDKGREQFAASIPRSYRARRCSSFSPSGRISPSGVTWR